MRRLLPKSEYARNSIISIVGVGFAAIIPFLLKPFLGRIFSPDEFRLMGLFFSISQILAIAANFRYGYVVAITNTDDEAKNVLAGSLFLSFIFSFITLVIFMLLGKEIAHLFSFDLAIVKWFYLIPVSVFCTSACIGFNGWLNRRKAFTAIAINKSARKGGEGLFQLVLGKIKIAGGLIYGLLIGDLINLLVHFVQFKKVEGNFKAISVESVKANLRRYIDFPKFNLVPALLDTISLALPFFIVNAYYSKEISGQFYQSRDLLALPLVLVSMALSQVLLQKLTERRKQNENVMTILKRHIYFLSGMGIVGVIVVYLFGETLFVLFLGDQWKLAGNMASLMVVAYAFKFIVSPLSVLFFALEKVKIAGLWQVAYFGGMCCLFLFPTLDIKDFILLYVLIEVLFYIIYLALIMRIGKQYDASLNQGAI